MHVIIRTYSGASLSRSPSSIRHIIYINTSVLRHINLGIKSELSLATGSFILLSLICSRPLKAFTPPSTTFNSPNDHYTVRPFSRSKNPLAPLRPFHPLRSRCVIAKCPALRCPSARSQFRDGATAQAGVQQLFGWVSRLLRHGQSAALHRMADGGRIQCGRCQRNPSCAQERHFAAFTISGCRLQTRYSQHRVQVHVVE